MHALKTRIQDFLTSRVRNIYTEESILLSYTPVEERTVKLWCKDVVVCDIRASVIVLESLAPFHTRKAQDSSIRKWPGKKCLCSCLKP